MALNGNSCGIKALDLALLSASETKSPGVDETRGLVDVATRSEVVAHDRRVAQKIRIPCSMQPFNHKFYTVESDIIVDYDFTLLNTDVTPGSDLFRVSAPFSVELL